MRKLCLVGLAIFAFACGGGSSNNNNNNNTATDMATGGGNDGPAGVDGSNPGTDGSSPGTDGSGPVVDMSSSSGSGFCDPIYGAFLDTLQNCCTAADQASQTYQFIAGFVAIGDKACNDEVAASLGKGRITSDANAASQCGAAIKAALTCASLTMSSGGQSALMTQSCMNIVTGMQAAGMPCAFDFECQAGLTCVGWGQNTDGTCKAPPAAGQACGPVPNTNTVDGLSGYGNHPRCASGNFCNNQTGMCEATHAAGEACGVTAVCQSGLYCVNFMCSTTPPAAAGSPCMQDGDCQTGLYCANPNGTGGTCTAKAKAGAACATDGSGAECLGLCNTPMGASKGTCAAFCGSG